MWMSVPYGSCPIETCSTVFSAAFTPSLNTNIFLGFAITTPPLCRNAQSKHGLHAVELDIALQQVHSENKLGLPLYCYHNNVIRMGTSLPIRTRKRAITTNVTKCRNRNKSNISHVDIVYYNDCGGVSWRYNLNTLLIILIEFNVRELPIVKLRMRKMFLFVCFGLKLLSHAKIYNTINNCKTDKWCPWHAQYVIARTGYCSHVPRVQCGMAYNSVINHWNKKKTIHGNFPHNNEPVMYISKHLFLHRVATLQQKNRSRINMFISPVSHNTPLNTS